jgi:hypothetical protein
MCEANPLVMGSDGFVGIPAVLPLQLEISAEKCDARPVVLKSDFWLSSLVSGFISLHLKSCLASFRK